MGLGASGTWELMGLGALEHRSLGSHSPEGCELLNLGAFGFQELSSLIVRGRRSAGVEELAIKKERS